MKKRLLQLACFIALWSFGKLPSLAQGNLTDMQTALDVLKGKEVSNSKEWAVGVLETSLEEKRDAYTLNVLAIAYLHGIGTEADTLKAIKYFEESGAAGFNLAYHNLGMYYKYADNGKQDFKKAYDTFAQGAQAGSTPCHYNKGFMLYKGLGCQQDYAAAVEEFQLAADREHPSSLFMLGLCYRNGYGVEPDTARANFYLRRAAILGSSDAMEELQKDTPENSWKRITLGKNDLIDIPDEMPTIDPYLPNEKETIGGDYAGYLVSYDWSGENVLSEIPLRVVVGNVKDSVDCTWYIANDTIATKAKLTNGGELLFNNEEVVRYDRYSASYTSRYKFDRAEICYIGNYITGQLRLYSLDEQEPEKPMYVCLLKNGSAQEGSETINNRVYSYPNPYTDVVTLKFELDAAVPSANICLYTQSGVCKQNYKVGALEAGEHSFNIYPDPSENSYIVHVIAGGNIYQTIIFKKR